MEEAREEARIKAQEEVVVKIQEAKVRRTSIRVIADLYLSPSRKTKGLLVRFVSIFFSNTGGRPTRTDFAKATV